MNDTIFALATGPARAAIAMVRISGPRSGEALAALAGALPTVRQASLRTLRAPHDGRVLDQAVILWFQGPASFTGEDQAELHLHGGAAVVAGVTDALSGMGLRPAAPGEFTRRAFEHGKLDLTEAEAIADLIDAETRAQRDQAIAQLGGGVSRRQEIWRAALIEASGRLEADIDFPDDGIPSGLEAQARQIVVGLLGELDASIGDLRGQQVREGYRIALLGPPNAGKSSLLNALVQRDTAIVTEIAGTTRDVIEAPLTIKGFRVLIADTAGIRESRDVIEAEGIRRAQVWSSDASLRVLTIDQSEMGEDWRAAGRLLTTGDLLILNKSDLAMGRGGLDALAWAQDQGIRVARCQANIGLIDEVITAVSDKVVSALSGSDTPTVTRTRHRAILLETAECLRRGLASGNTEQLAEDVRLAGRALAQLVGAIGAEDVLDFVFGAFCIGK